MTLKNTESELIWAYYSPGKLAKYATGLLGMVNPTNPVCLTSALIDAQRDTNDQKMNYIIKLFKTTNKQQIHMKLAPMWGNCL